MTEPTPVRSPLYLATAFAVRWVLWGVIVMGLFFALAWSLLHFWIVPRIGELRPLIESRASQILGVRVRVDAVSAQSLGLVPSFELSQVRLFDASGREALRLPRVVATLSPASLARLGFEQLYIDRPELAIKRTAEGKIYVAGLDLSSNQDLDHSAFDWLFAQSELVIHQGAVEWSDELRGVPALKLEQVDVVLRNGLRLHQARIDATPPPLWGERFTAMAQFKAPLRALSGGQWRHWDGQLHADFKAVDISQLGRYAELGMEVAQGRGAVRAWLDVARGQLVGATADVALTEVALTLVEPLQPLELTAVTGRLGGRLLAKGFEFSTRGLQFNTRQGQHWPGGDLHLNYSRADGITPARGELSADQLDLAALAQIAHRLPLDTVSSAALLRLEPKGRVQRVEARWQGPLTAPEKFSAKGQVRSLALAMGAAVQPHPDLPGVEGANVDFDLNETSGRLSLLLQKGRLKFPGLFEEPVLEFDQLSTDALWQIDGEKLSLQLPNLKFSNADAQGEAQLQWQTGEPRPKAVPSGAGPGVLDLRGSLSRANGARVHRYLPTLLSPGVRHYVRDAILKASISGAKFRVRGDLRDLPFADPKLGEFQISAQARDATWAYVPRELQTSQELPWPALSSLSGELLFDRSALHFKNLKSGVTGAPGLQFTKSEASIPDLGNAVTVNVRAEARGPLNELLQLVKVSPLAGLTDKALQQSSASGAADYRFRLSLPLAALGQSRAQGAVTLSDNEFALTPDTPRLSRVRGQVNFSEKGFNVAVDQARMLGGELRLEGGTVEPLTASGGGSGSVALPGPSLVLRAQGSVSAAGLRQAKELGAIARMAEHASGSTPYSAVLSVRSGIPELRLHSSLQGLALNMPEPLVKSAATALPLQFERVLLRAPRSPVHSAAFQDRVGLKLGNLAALEYVRELSGEQTQVVRGAITVGLASDETLPLPNAGVAANIQLETLDMDAWNVIFSGATGVNAAAGAAGPSAARELSGTEKEALSYLPTTMAIRARELSLAGRKLHQVVVGGGREGLLWRANLDATELNGYLEYRQSSGAEAGRVYARLARLTLAPAAAKEVEAFLVEQPLTIPALDIVVDDFELRGKKMGRVEIAAVNLAAPGPARATRSSEWRLHKFNVLAPDSVFTATGNWSALTDPGAARNSAPRRRTLMQFKLEIADAGELLSRLGMKDVVRRGKGKMEGQVEWLGSPLALDYPTLGGAFHVNVETGQFLKADPGIAKLLGVLNLQALPRRLVLDFRDVFSEGFAFDFFRGDVTIAQGMARTNNLQMKGVNAAVLMEGRADIAKETQDVRVVVVPEINTGTASLIATAINPAVGLGTFLAQLILRRPLIQSNTQEFSVTGSWAEPHIVKVEPAPATPPSSQSNPRDGKDEQRGGVKP